MIFCNIIMSEQNKNPHNNSVSDLDNNDVQESYTYCPKCHHSRYISYKTCI